MSKKVPSLYERDLDRFATREMKNPASQTPDKLYRYIQGTFILRIAEALILADRLVFRAEGENVVLAFLVKSFGFEQIRRLLKNGAIEFRLASEEVVYSVDDALAKKGLLPLSPMRFNCEPHIDHE